MQQVREKVTRNEVELLCLERLLYHSSVTVTFFFSFYNDCRQTVEDEETLRQSFSEAESEGAQAASEQTAIYGR